MFKRVERKRKRREEEEELGLDQDTKQVLGLNDTDSDESDSSSEQDSAQSDVGEDRDQDVASEDEDINENAPISVEEVLKDPIYLVSLDPSVYGCVLCKGKLIKNAGMATAHKSASVHKRRFKRFRLLSADVDPRSNAWELARLIKPTSMQKLDSEESSNRVSKRQAKQIAIREKRKRHKELKAKAIAKKALKKLSATDGTKLHLAAPSESQPTKIRKKQEPESKISTRSSGVAVKSTSRTKTSSDSKKLVVKSVTKGIRNKAL